MKFLSLSLLIAAISSFSTVLFARECPRLQGSIRLSAVGDILVHEMLFRAAVEQPQRFRSLWAPILPSLNAADLTVGNLEGPVAPGTLAGGRSVSDPGFTYDGEVYSGTNFVFNYHPLLLKDLLSSGFDFVTTANNHAMDRGPLGVDRTIEQLQKAGLPFAGTRVRNATDWDDRTLKSNGSSIGVVACTEMVNGQPDPYHQTLRCSSKEVFDLINRLKTRVDAVIVFPHWGEEYQLRPNSYQKDLGKRWIEAGALAVIGNHPHVLQTVQWMTRPDGSRGVIIYSLGNFVASQGAMEKRTSAVVHLDLTPGPRGLTLDQYSYTPIVREHGSIALNYLKRDSEELRHVQRQLGSEICVKN